MATFEFVLPELGEGIETGDVVQVLVAVGDTITQEQSVLELETDKAVLEVPAPVGGTVQAIHVQPGDKAAVGQLLLTLDTNVAQASKASSTPSAPPPESPAIATPEREERPAPEQPATASSTPSTPPPESPPVATPEREERPAPEQPAAAGSAPPQALAPAAPSTRRLAREIGVDIHQVPGSGPGGRISAEDVKSYARRLNTGAAGAQPGAAAPAAGLPDMSKWGAVQRQPMSNVRRVTAEHLTRSWQTIPHVTQYDKADITALEQLRQRFSKQVEAAGGRLTITAIVLKVLASALKVFPQFNASVDMTTHEIVYKQYYHIGVAVDTDRGLLVPVIRDVNTKNILTLSVEITQLAERARTRKTTLEEMQGGTFTVTNLGGIGGTYFAPIINAPEVAILGLARGRMEPVYHEGQFVPRLLLPLSLSYDHRIIDGADGIRFLRWVAEALEQPFLLALEG